MKYAVGLFGDRVWVVSAVLLNEPPYIVDIAESCAFKGKSFGAMYLHSAALIKDKDTRFDHVMCKPNMAKLPWKIFGQRENE